jgi:signal transduction histidine kinase
MIERLRRTLSSEIKLIAFTAVVVLLPTTVLSVLQYRSLAELEKKTKAAVQEDLRQTLQQVARQVAERLTRSASDYFSQFEPKDFEPQNLEQTKERLSTFRQTNPEVRQFFILADCSCQKNQFALFYKPDGWQLVTESGFAGNQLVKQAREQHRNAQLLHKPGEHSHGADFWQDSCSVFSGTHESGHKSQLEAFVFLPLKQPDQEHPYGHAGLVLDDDYLKQQFFPRHLSELLREAAVAFNPTGAALLILDERQRAVYGDTTKVKRYEARLPFTPAFPKWELAIGYNDTTIEALARGNFQRSLLLTGCVLALLLGGMLFALRVAARELKLAEAKSTFVSNVSHELKTPLALIRLFAETLELGRVKNEEKAQEYYRIINHESRRLTQLINNILDFSKIEAGRKEYQFVTTDVAELVREVLKSYEYQMTSAGFEIETNVQTDLPSALLDRDAIAQAVLNLLNNAVKYSDAVRRVTVRVRAQDRHIAIEVADCGIGIPRAEHEKVFEKFYRVSTGLVHDTKGTGLGLALVKHIIEAHRGRVLLESAPGQGSRFTLLLPACEAEQRRADLGFDAGGYQVAENPHH